MGDGRQESRCIDVNKHNPLIAAPALNWRQLDDADLPAVAELGLTCLQSDGGLGSMFESDAVSARFFADLPGERLGAFTPDQLLVAAAAVHIDQGADPARAVIVGHVRPTFRGRGIGNQLLNWSESVAAGMFPGDRVNRQEIRTESLTDAADHLYRDHGFEQKDVSLVMRRDLRSALPQQRLPPGVATVSWKPESMPVFARVYEPAFRDRPGFPGWNSAEWIGQARANDLVPEWSLVATTPTGPLGYVIGCLDSSTTPPGGYIWQVGVIATERRRGIGAALLLASMRTMQADGALAAGLVVHVDNPSAIQTYESIGFTTVGRRARYERLRRP